MANEKRVIMKHSLAKALMDAGMEHFDGGGVISAGNSNFLSGISGALTTQNSYNANGPNMGDVVANQNALAGQLGNEASGGGPNPAQAQYQQNAQQIAQQQAALNAQNRALNPGLAARQSSNAAVQSGQQAAGGAAAQQAQQQIAAQQQLAQLYGQQQNTALGAEGLNAQVSQNNANSVNQTEGGLLNSIGGFLGGLFAKGGQVPDHLMKVANIYHAKKYAVGGSVNVPGLPNFSNAATLMAQQDQKDNKQGPANVPAASQGPLSATGANNFGAAPLSMPELGASEGVGSAASAGAPGLLSELGPMAVLALKSGGSVPGKAKVKGDSEKNDTVPIMASAGEEVIDRETMNDPGPIGQMARTVAQHIAQKNGQDEGGGKAADFMKSLSGGKDKNEDDPQKGYSKVAEARKKKGKR